MGAIVPPYLSTADQQVFQSLVAALDSERPRHRQADPGSLALQARSCPEFGDCGNDLWPLKLVLSGAIEKRDAQPISFVLDFGLKVELYAMMGALDVESVEVFQAFIDHGWSINELIGHNQPPYLAYESPSRTRYYSPFLKHVLACNKY